MKGRNFILAVYIFSFCISFVSASFNFGTMTGRAIEGMEKNLSNMSKDELMALYEVNKDSLTKEDIEILYEQNKDKISEEFKEVYEQNKDLITDDNIDIFVESFENGEDFSFNEENLELYLKLLTCSFIRPVIDSEISNIEIPEKVPFRNEIFNIYLDDEFLITLSLINKEFQDSDCEKSEEVTYDVYVKSELILNSIENKEEIDPIEYYNQNRKNGNLDIKPVGFGRKLKMGFINLGLKIVSWFN